MSAPTDDAAPADTPWLEISVRVARGWAELTAELLGQAPASPAAVAEDGEHALVTTWVPPEAPADLLEQRERALATLLRQVDPEHPAPRLERRGSDPASWAGPAWRAFRVGHVCIVPPGESPALRERDVVIRLEPGAAFGTGRHATTRTCLRVLQGLPLAGARVLDVGCGTGLLGLTCARLGAAHATLLDDDPLATDCARELVAAHDLQAVCDVVTGDLSAAARLEPFDVLIANLEGPQLCERAADLAPLLKPGGSFLVSGIQTPVESDVVAAFAAVGLAVRSTHGTWRWRALTGSRGG